MIEDDRKKVLEAWLRHRNYSVADLMFGERYVQPDGSRQDLFGFLKTVDTNLPVYEELYMEDRLDAI